MGRPLNKKYFGNRNIGTNGNQTTQHGQPNATDGDDHIGGEGIADVTIPDAGNWLATAGGSNVPVVGLTLPAPTIANGVQATWSVTYGIEHVTTGAGSVGLVVGETYTSAAFPGSIITVVTSGNNSSNATFTVTNQGATGTIPTDLQGVNITRRSVPGYTGVSTFLVDIFTHIKGITIEEKGSGYTGAETFDIQLANGATGSAPSGLSLVLTQDTGAVGSATNQENAIIAFALLDGLEEVDIVRQVSTDRYRINSNATGNQDVSYFVGRLVSDKVANATIPSTHTGINETEMNIWAFDEDGGSYLVQKLTARKAVVVPFACARLSKSAGTRFPLNDDGTPKRAPWKFFESQTNADAGYVKIENA